MGNTEKTEMQHKQMEKCCTQEMEIKNVRLAAAYVPWQYLCKIFQPAEALKRGTVFPELYSPYEKKDKRKRPCECK